MNVTAILCTYNRCQTLRKALDSVVASTLPDSVTWEVLVVDNNSTDETRQVVEDFCHRYPGRVRYLFEPRQGLCRARNAGIQQARGNVLAFMDDDVIVEPSWLQNLTAGLHDGKWAGAGGRVLLQWTCPPPGWLPLQDRYGLAPLASLDLGLEPGPLTEPPFGTNMAFRKEVFQKYGDFRTDLDRCGDGMLSNGDTEFGGRLLNAQERLLYAPSAVVYHPTPPSRVQKQYFLAWWFGKARADVREFGVSSDNEWLIAGVPLIVLRKLAVWSLRWMIALEPRRRFAAKLRVWGCIGRIKESFTLAHAARRHN